VSGGTVQNNTVINNQVGVYSGFQTLNFNNIYGNTLNVNYTLTTDANATLNWWGTTDTAAIAASIHDYNDDFLLGRANYAPFLDAPNTEAPAPDSPVIPETHTEALLLAVVALSVVAITTARIKTKRSPSTV
jgi:hypothetical protein